MSGIAIRAEGLSKRYFIGPRNSDQTFREALARTFTSPFQKRPSRDSGEFWALNGVSFDVPRGKAVGIIGHNGAGKSTLLKILSRITEPTTGRAEVYGRVGSLLEVGTGFHPELTGRENVYLNGAILGMKRSEIERKFDEIIAFADVERFIDTPVKHFSSGMYVRLAFAVAAHLEPEILIVDEVLAVGDAAFQRRCVEHFQKMERDGRTILLISHNMAIVKKVCHRAILLENGRLLDQGDVNRMVERYLQSQPILNATGAGRRFRHEDDPVRWGNGQVAITAVRTMRSSAEVHQFNNSDTVITIAIEFAANFTIDDAVVGIAINTSAGTLVFATNSQELQMPERHLIPGKSYRAEFHVSNVFGDGLYTISCAVNNRDRSAPYARVEEARTFEVTGRGTRGLIWPPHTLTVELCGTD